MSPEKDYECFPLSKPSGEMNIIKETTVWRERVWAITSGARVHRKSAKTN